MSIRHLLIGSALAASAFSSNAFAGCHLVFQGINSHFECDEDTPTVITDPQDSPSYATARVCNGTGEKLWVSIAERTFSNDKLSHGWWVLENGQCQSFNQYTDARVLYANANTASGQQWYPRFDTNDLDDSATFCVNKTQAMNRLGVDTCHHNVPGFEFRNFGRVSGFSSFTFRH